MMYAVISEKDNQTSLAYFKSKKIPQANFVSVSKLQQLIQTLSAGDMVHVVSVDRFPSVETFINFAMILFKMDVSMKILEQPYLDIVNGKRYKFGIERHLKALAELEYVNINRLISVLKCNSAGNQYIYRCVTDITVGILAKSYAADGILHREK